MNISLDGKELDKIMNTLSIGMSRSFRLLGGMALLISIWQNNELGIRLSLITFIYGGFAKIIEMLNKDIDKKCEEKKINSAGYQSLFWLVFIVSYILAVNSYTGLFEVSSFKNIICK